MLIANLKTGINSTPEGSHVNHIFYVYNYSFCLGLEFFAAGRETSPFFILKTKESRDSMLISNLMSVKLDYIICSFGISYQLEINNSHSFVLVLHSEQQKSISVFALFALK